MPILSVFLGYIFFKEKLNKKRIFSITLVLISIILILLFNIKTLPWVGLVVGFIAAIMGIGGAFILVPAMIYIIKMPTRLVPGTSLFVTIFVSVIVTFLHSINYGHN